MQDSFEYYKSIAMKKSFLLLLPWVFLFISCEEFGIPGLSFDYNYDFVVPIEAPLLADSSDVINVNVEENGLRDELESRGIQFIDNITLNRITFTIPDSVEADFSYLREFSASLIIDGVLYPLDFVSKISELASDGGKTLTVESNEGTPSFDVLMDAKEIELEYNLIMEKTLTESVELGVRLHTTITTAFVD